MRSEPAEVRVESPGGAYSVWVGESLLERAHELIPLPDRVEMVTLLADPNALALHGDRAAKGIDGFGVRAERYTFAGGEEGKTMREAEAAMRFLAASGAHRSDLVMTLGGGVASDLGGFIAATYMRGIAVAHMPTTVLAQVDAAIGGKTGANLPEGKNLAGAFHHPVAVLADVGTLATLPDAELASGFAEVAKHGFIGDTEILSRLVVDSDAIAGRDPWTLQTLIAAAVAVKARIVAEDPTEQGPRAFLNYGHTLGHALEAWGGYVRWRHGEAVSIGMMFAAELARGLGFADRVSGHRRALASLGLPTAGASAPLEEIAPLWARDKKYLAGVRFVVLEDWGRPRVVSDVPQDAIRGAYEAVR